MKKGIYILPTIFTLGNIVCGMLAVFASVDGNFSRAAWLILASIALDILDGRVARMTNTQSLFGVQMDSFADIISFGVAPSFMMYKMALTKLNNPGVAIAIFYVVAVAIRLAKYNVKALDNAGEPESFFEGLPSPAAAGILASFVLSYELFQTGQQVTVKTIPLIEKQMPFFLKTIPVTMVLSSLLMLSGIRYAGFKRIRINRAQSVQFLALVVTAIFLILSYPQNTIFVIFLFYLISGLVGYMLRLWQISREKRLRSLQLTDKDR
ncbi:MAG: CDP-diacylglycerol--serine O-phosphatidyltransferase [Endomicrobiia bacterium]|nr:CDP-diacylglycerol--serine O-phosphatidyltransferase [Endomicrobiia bacterium]